MFSSNSPGQSDKVDNTEFVQLGQELQAAVAAKYGVAVVFPLFC